MNPLKPELILKSDPVLATVDGRTTVSAPLLVAGQRFFRIGGHPDEVLLFTCEETLNNALSDIQTGSSRGLFQVAARKVILPSTAICANGSKPDVNVIALTITETAAHLHLSCLGVSSHVTLEGSANPVLAANVHYTKSGLSAAIAAVFTHSFVREGCLWKSGLWPLNVNDFKTALTEGLPRHMRNCANRKGSHSGIGFLASESLRILDNDRDLFDRMIAFATESTMNLLSRNGAAS